MDFMDRGGRLSPNSANPGTGHGHVDRGSDFEEPESKLHNGIRYGMVALLFSVTVLLAALGIYLGTSGGNRTIYAENALLEKDRYQAVFLNGGQVYFGKIKVLNSKFLTVEDIYYLRVNQQVQPGQTQASNADISLAKLGNELHGPQDKMVINREQVMFWENLKDDGQVVKAITDYKQNGGASSNAEQGSSNTNTTPATTPTTPATTPPPATNRR